MSEPNDLTGIPITTAAHTIEMNMRARVILDTQGKPASIILIGDQGVEMKWPGYAFPFVNNGAAVLVVTTVVQVSQAKQQLAPKILLPGNRT